jgi:hypothetical protein
MAGIVGHLLPMTNAKKVLDANLLEIPDARYVNLEVEPAILCVLGL